MSFSCRRRQGKIDSIAIFVFRSTGNSNGAVIRFVNGDAVTTDNSSKVRSSNPSAMADPGSPSLIAAPPISHGILAVEQNGPLNNQQQRLERSASRQQDLDMADTPGNHDRERLRPTSLWQPLSIFSAVDGGVRPLRLARDTGKSIVANNKFSMSRHPHQREHGSVPIEQSHGRHLGTVSECNSKRTTCKQMVADESKMHTIQSKSLIGITKISYAHRFHTTWRVINRRGASGLQVENFEGNFGENFGWNFWREIFGFQGMGRIIIFTGRGSRVRKFHHLPQIKAFKAFKEET
ncbi:hypothetical protein ACLOJK_032793, partial [Asimina triloba]